VNPAPFQPGTALYLHVPFCASSCDFCSFYQEQPKRGDLDRYLGAIERELALRLRRGAWRPRSGAVARLACCRPMTCAASARR
jgi:coproporphyrinogen III oxidase-like Fe-S oxidoreductase